MLFFLKRLFNKPKKQLKVIAFIKSDSVSAQIAEFDNMLDAWQWAKTQIPNYPKNSYQVTFKQIKR